MCEICRQSPCDARCPNADPPKVFGQCDECGADLTVDNAYFEDDDGNIFCSEDCALEFYGIRGREWYDG